MTIVPRILLTELRATLALNTTLRHCSWLTRPFKYIDTMQLPKHINCNTVHQSRSPDKSVGSWGTNHSPFHDCTQYYACFFVIEYISRHCMSFNIQQCAIKCDMKIVKSSHAFTSPFHPFVRAHRTRYAIAWFMLPVEPSDVRCFPFHSHESLIQTQHGQPSWIFTTDQSSKRRASITRPVQKRQTVSEKISEVMETAVFLAGVPRGRRYGVLFRMYESISSTLEPGRRTLSRRRDSGIGKKEPKG